LRADDHNGRLELPGFVFDIADAELSTSSGTRVTLRPQVLAVLRCLARRPGFLRTKDELLQAVWPGLVVTEDSLVQCICELRRALDDRAHRIIRTEPRRGYRLLAAQPPLRTGDVSAADAFHQDIRFATSSDGVRLAWASSGSGPPLVRAAHWMTHLDWDWRSATLGPRIRSLARDHRLVRYDGRGYGLSDWVAPGTLEQSVGDLETVVDSAGLERFVLLGTSSGAPIAIRFAARHPQRVSGLVLLGGYARGVLRRAAASPSTENFDALLRVIEDGWAQDNPAFRQLLTSLYWPGATAQQMQSFNELQHVSCAPKAAAALMRRSATIDVSGDLPRLRCPTLVLHSPRDAGVPFEESRRIAAAVPGARFEPFDSDNHTPLADEPAFEQVQAMINGFVARLGHDRVGADRTDSRRTALHAVDGARDADLAPPATKHAA
jgi:pimeloyl-ACP methyl ester carboxylesterase/DNA-binding winged helix-turn-helix (wHTH) protein